MAIIQVRAHLHARSDARVNLSEASWALVRKSRLRIKPFDGSQTLTVEY
jgi:hypothetical protein